MTDIRARRAELVRRRLGEAGWTAGAGAEGPMERTGANGAAWACALETAEDADSTPEILRLRIRKADDSFIADLMLDVRGSSDPAGVFDGPVDRLGELLETIAALPPTVTEHTVADKVLMPLLVCTAVFSRSFGVPVHLAGALKERLPRPASGPLPQAVAAALAAPRDPGRWLDVAFAALDVHFPHLTLSALDRALAAGADPAVPELWRGWLLRSTDPGEALAALDRAAAAGGVTGPARCLQAAFHQVGGDAERELAAWERATRGAPDDAYAWGMWGLTLVERGRPAGDVLRVFTDGVTANPHDATLRYYLGYGRMLAGDGDGAFDSLEEAIRLRPALTGEIVADPDLAELRDHERFARLTSVRADHNGQDAGTTDILRRLAATLASALGADKTQDGRPAHLIATIGDGAARVDISRTSAEGQKRDLDVNIEEVRTLLNELQRRGLPYPYTVIELTVHTEGWFEALMAPASRGSHGRDRLVHVLGRPDERFDSPGDLPGPPEDPAEAGDPAEAVSQLREYVRLRATILDDDETLPDPDPDRADTFAALAEDHDVVLPADLRALYDVSDGEGDLGGLLDDYEWLTADELDVDATEREWTVDVHENTWLDGAVSDSGPPGAVRRSHDRPGWIPFAYGGGLDYLAVDMDPAENGRPGQVIRIGMRRPRPEYVADSVTALLRRHVDALRQGRYFEDGYLEIDLGDMTDLRRNAADDPDRTYRTHGTVDGAGICATTRTLEVTAGADVDLTAVRGAPLLCRAELRCESADLEPLNTVPIGELKLDLLAVDLSPLAGNGTLRTLTVTAPHGVDLEPLCSAERLAGLDLSRAAARDVTVLGRMRGLRHLSLRYEQWLELWASDGTPPRLAVAILDGEHSPTTKADWLNQLAPATAHQYIGTFSVA
ncbi:SMI1/KNR4 family protein [Streptomyces sp. NBC_01506]|uniref:SMI1/KNR4 family protein n=1 Tax=Streptomyces sp. NBC_01506 TaxID=2903887 RepID=UPI0038641420